jgi:hypothetical protein
MKLILTILFLFSVAYGQTNYYVSNSGNDANNGLTPATAWQTLHKVNVSTFSNGDSILLKRGDVWNDSLIINHGQLNFGAYSAGVKPEITGFQSATMTSAGSNIWTGTLTNAPNHYFDTSTNGIGTVLKSSMNCVTIDGQFRAKARYPNPGQIVTPAYAIGWLTTAFYGTQSQKWIKSDQSLASNYVGSEIVSDTHPWEYDVSLVTNQSGDTLFYTPVFSYGLTARSRFFLQNLPIFLDQQYEWCYNDTTKLLSVYSTTAPVVHYSTIDTLIHSNKYDSISFYGIKFSGANRHVLSMDTSDYINVSNCTFDLNGFDGVFSRSSNYSTFRADSFTNTLNNAIYLFGQHDTVDNCYGYNTSTVFGMGGAGNGQKNFFIGGTLSTNSYSQITNNRIFKTGYTGISLYGQHGFVYRNRIDSFCLVASDGGGVYLPVGQSKNVTIRSNIVTNGIGGENDAPGIYSDSNNDSTYIDSNTVSNAFIYGIFLGSNTNYHVTYNKIVDSIGYPLAYYGGTGVKNSSSIGNIAYIKNSSYPIFASTGVLLSVDSNYYIPTVPTDTLLFYDPGKPSYWQHITFKQWNDSTGFDSHSTNIAPSNIVSQAQGALHWNDSQSDSTISLSGLYIDAKGAEHNSSILLHPFQSTLLFKADHEIPVPPSPTTGKKIGNLKFR